MSAAKPLKIGIFQGLALCRKSKMRDTSLEASDMTDTLRGAANSAVLNMALGANLSAMFRR